MGLRGIALQDVRTRRVVAIRVNPWKGQHASQIADVRDTVSAFGVHCARLAVVQPASTTVDAMAKWRGSPEILYDVVNGPAFSARVLVLYDDAEDDLDILDDAEIALSRLASTVRGLPDLRDLTSFNEQAAMALAGPYFSDAEYADALTHTTPSTAQTASKSNPVAKFGAALARRRAAPPSDKALKKGGIGFIRRASQRSIPQSQPTEPEDPPEPTRPPKPTARPSATPLPELTLPDACFTIATVGAPIPDGPGNLQWFARLLLSSDATARPPPAVAAPPPPPPPALTAPPAPPEHNAEPPQLPAATVARDEPPDSSVDQVRDAMNTFAETIQGGDFPRALEQILATLRLLATPAGRGEDPDGLRERETNTCVAYALAMRIIMRVRALEAELARVPVAQRPAVHPLAAQMAVLTVFLAELPLVGKHKLVALKMAAERNLPVGNNAVAARYLGMLAELAPEDRRAEFARKRQDIVANGKPTNAIKPPTTRLCYSTLQLVHSPMLKCLFCPALFHPAAPGLAPDTQCPLCLRGKLQSQP